MDIPWIPVGAVTAALIAGFISLVNVLIAKDEKITAFRQEWINSLREEISRLVALASTISSLRHIIDVMQNKEVSRSDALNEMQSVLKTETAQCLECRNRIHLFLNPDENEELIKKIESLHEASKISSNAKHQQVQELCDDVLLEAQRVLKKEWKRVKRGEPSYVIMKNGVLFTSLALLVVALLMSQNFWAPTLIEALGLVP